MKTKNKFLFEKEGERVSNIVAENAKKTSKRIARGSTKPITTKRNSRYPIIEKTKKDFLCIENEILTSKVSMLESKIEQGASQYLELKKVYESYVETTNEFTHCALKGLLVLTITYLDQIILSLEEFGDEEQVNLLLKSLSFLLKKYRDFEDPQEYLSFIDCLKSENLERIQNHMRQTSE